MGVDAGVDDEPVVDGDVAVVGREGAQQVLADVVGHVAPVLPDEVAGHRVDGLDDVVGVGHVQHPAVGERRARLEPLGEPPRPDHAQVADVLLVDLVEGAVAPAVGRAAPRQPVLGGRRLQHGVGDGHEVAGGLCVDMPARGKDQNRHPDYRHAPPRGRPAVHRPPPFLRSEPHIIAQEIASECDRRSPPRNAPSSPCGYR